MSNYYEPKRESYYMGDEDDWRVLWPKSEYDKGFEAVFGKTPKEPVQPKYVNSQKIIDEYLRTHKEEPAQPVKVKKHTDGTRTIQVGAVTTKTKLCSPGTLLTHGN